MGSDVRVITNTDPGFYPLLGPFLARREVVKTVGGPLWDDDTKTWFVALSLRGGLRLESLYTVDQDPALTRRLITIAVRDHKHQRIQAVVRHRLADAHYRAGFVTTSTTLEFTRLVREAT